MSTGLSCLFVEPEPNQWYYILQKPCCPVQCWDWLEENPECWGPFPSEEEANAHLHRYHANPGGGEIIEHAAYQANAVYEALFAQARTASRFPFSPYGPR